MIAERRSSKFKGVDVRRFRVSINCSRDLLIIKILAKKTEPPKFVNSEVLKKM